MYLLRELTQREIISREVAEVRRLSQIALQEAQAMAEAHSAAKEEAQLKLADHGYAAGNSLSADTSLLRDELLAGRGSFYAQHFYGRTLSSEEKYDVARAIVLTRSSWFPRSPFDPIAKKLTRMALLENLPLKGRWTAFSVDGRANVDIDTIFERSELFGKIDRNMGGVRFEGHPISIRTDKGSISLNLLVAQKNELFHWELRGKSKFNPSDRRLVRELNRIADDQRQRTAWAEDYQAAVALPGLTPEQEQELLDEFGNWNNSMPTTLPGARPGVHFEDEPAKVHSTRVYPVRCASCSQLSAYEVVYCSGELVPEKAYQDPQSKHIHHRDDVEHSVNTMLKKFHRAAGCYSVHGTSSRTGESLCTDDIGWLTY